MDITTALATKTEPTWWLKDWCGAEYRSKAQEYEPEIRARKAEEMKRLAELRNTATGELLALAFEHNTIEEVEKDKRYKRALQAHKTRVAMRESGLQSTSIELVPPEKIITGKVQVSK